MAVRKLKPIEERDPYAAMVLESFRNLTAKKDDKPVSAAQVSSEKTMWGCLQCGVYFVSQQDLTLHWKEQGGLCKRYRRGPMNNVFVYG